MTIEPTTAASDAPTPECGDVPVLPDASFDEDAEFYPPMVRAI